MTAPNIALRRLHSQQLEGTALQTPGEVVAWLGAVQAQEYALAKWALGLRMKRASDDMIEQAFTDGVILRTHVMRPTWHFVAPDDLRWLLALTAPRVNAVNAAMYRSLELDDALFRRSHAAIAKALAGGQQLTRAELGSVLAQAGIVAQGVRLGYILHRAELDAIVCSGARRGKQFTYALLDERATRARSLARDEALAELVRRYFTSHGPARPQDFAWWSGLTVADARAGLEMARPQLVQETIDGQTYWFSPSMPAVKEIALAAHLLPPYDEYMIGYKDRSAALDPAYTEQTRSREFTAFVSINGQIRGMWKRTFSKGAVVVAARPFSPLTAAERDAFASAAKRYGEFLDMPVVLS